MYRLRRFKQKIIFVNSFKEKVANLSGRNLFSFFKRNIKILGVLIILISSYYILSNTVFPTKTIAQADAPAPAPNPVEVEVVSAKTENIKIALDVTGKVEALKTASIRPQVGGIVKKLLFKQGSYVKKGQQLYQIDDTLYKIDLKKAEANLQSLSLKLNRFKELIKIGAISRQEFDDLESEHTNAVESLKQAKTNLEYSKVYAPISGYIGETNFTEGALVSANQAEEMAVINQIAEIYVSVKQSSKDFSIIKNQKDDISVEINLGKDSVIKDARIAFFENIVDSTTDSFLFKVLVDNKDLQMVPGMFVEAKLYLKPYDSIIIPVKCGYRDIDGGLFVWVIDDKNIVHKRKIIANKVYQNNWIIEQGLENGDIVVFEGVQKIFEGAPTISVFATDQFKK